MKKFHIALSVVKFENTVEDYGRRLKSKPCALVPGVYALWRTPEINFSIRKSDKVELRHFGFENDEATGFSQEKDVNGFIWEYFSATHQNEEIKSLWPEAQFKSKDLS